MKISKLRKQEVQIMIKVFITICTCQCVYAEKKIENDVAKFFL